MSPWLRSSWPPSSPSLSVQSTWVPQALSMPFSVHQSSSLTYLTVSLVCPSSSLLGRCSCLIDLHFSVGILVFRGRHILDVEGFPKRRFHLGKFGYVINVLALIFVIFTSGECFLQNPASRSGFVLTLLSISHKSVLPLPTCNTCYRSVNVIRSCEFKATHNISEFPLLTLMHLQCVIFLILGICGITWILQGKRHYTGPKDIDGLLALARHGLQLGQVVDEGLLQVPEKQGEAQIKESIVV